MLLCEERFNSATSYCFVVIEPQRERESEMERGLTNGFAEKETNWSYHNLHFLHWKALSNHLATDMVFPQRDSAYRAYSCFANGTCMARYLLQESIRFLLLLHSHQYEGWAAFCTVSPPSCLFIYRVFFIEKFDFSPAEARAVNR